MFFFYFVTFSWWIFFKFIHFQKSEFHKLANAKIFLSDCLACDSCITAEEAVKVYQQNPNEFFRVLNLNKVKGMVFICLYMPRKFSALTCQSKTLWYIQLLVFFTLPSLFPTFRFYPLRSFLKSCSQFFGTSFHTHIIAKHLLLVPYIQNSSNPLLLISDFLVLKRTMLLMTIIVFPGIGFGWYFLKFPSFFNTIHPVYH